MRFFGDLLNRSAIDEFGKTLARQLQKRLPKDRAGDPKRQRTELEIAIGHARGFQRTKKLGVYGVSRLANVFQWELIEAGYESGLAQQMGRDLASRLATDSPEKAPS